MLHILSRKARLMSKKTPDNSGSVEELCEKCRHYVILKTVENIETLKGPKETHYCSLLCLRIKEPVVECSAFIKRKGGMIFG